MNESRCPDIKIFMSLTNLLDISIFHYSLQQPSKWEWVLDDACQWRSIFNSRKRWHLPCCSWWGSVSGSWEWRCLLDSEHTEKWGWVQLTLSISNSQGTREFVRDRERVRDKERKIGDSLHKGTETLVRCREKFEIEGVRDRESELYFSISILLDLIFPIWYYKTCF